MRLRKLIVLLVLPAPLLAMAGPAADSLPPSRMLGTEMTTSPIANAAFAPGRDAVPAPPFAGVLHFVASELRTLPAIAKPVLDGRDARQFPGITLGFVTLGDTLVPLRARRDGARDRARRGAELLARDPAVWSRLA